MTKLLLTGIIAVAVLTVSCTSTFRVSKDGKGYILGSNSNAIHRMLCESCNLEKILLDTQLGQEKKDELYTYNCSTEKGGAKVKQLYAAMTPQERKDLRTAFKKNGYDINAMTC